MQKLARTAPEIRMSEPVTYAKAKANEIKSSDLELQAVELLVQRKNAARPRAVLLSP